jgi:hypothetical protein
VIALKHGIQRGRWCSEEARGSYGVSLWRHIRKNWGAFSNYVSYEVGDGLRIVFGMIFDAVIVLSSVIFLNSFP